MPHSKATSIVTTSRPKINPVFRTLLDQHCCFCLCDLFDGDIKAYAGECARCGALICNLCPPDNAPFVDQVDKHLAALDTREEQLAYEMNLPLTPCPVCGLGARAA